jgi:hypothetical protein
MELSNIKQVQHADSIPKLLKSFPGRFAIIGVTLQDTSNDSKIYIRKWLKEHSKHFPNILFIYLCAHDEELGKLSILKEDRDEYPYVYHICDTNKVCGYANNAEPETINELFSKMNDYYVKDREYFLESMDKNKEQDNDNQDDEISENNTNEDTNTNSNNDNVNNELKKKKENIANRRMTEKRKLDKLLILSKYSEKFKKDFLKDIKRRKIQEREEMEERSQ